MFQLKNYIAVALIYFLSCSIGIKAQDIEQLGGPLVSMSGNVSVGTSFYQAYNRDSRRSPFAYFITANPTLTVYGFDIPISLTFREQQGSVSNPFNRLSFNPRYKWITLNLGKFSKTLSTYSLSGAVISGAAVDLTPGKFRFSFVRGNMENALIQIDTILNMPEALPSYKRSAIGGKIGFGSNNNFIDLMAFKAKDDVNTIDQAFNNLQQNRPQENIVVGTAFGISPVKWVRFKAELSGSAHTANQESEDYFTSQDVEDLRESYGSLLTLNHSTKIQFAGSANLDFKFKSFGIGGEYKRVDPLYKSLGAFYFQEDYENILLKLNFSLLKGKLRFSSRGGIQRNNLNNLRKVTNTRQILNTSLTFIASKNLTVAARYTNFQTEREPGLIAVNDTLRYARSTASYSLTPRYIFGDKEKRSTIGLAFNHQNLTDVLAEDPTGNNIENNVANLSYSLNMRPSGTRVSFSLMGNRNLIKDIERDRYGLNAVFAKKLAKDQLTLSIGAGGFQNILDGSSEGYSITGKIGARYRVKKSIDLSTTLNFINRSGDTGYQEIRGNLRLTYRIPKVGTKKNTTNKIKSQTQNSK